MENQGYEEDQSRAKKEQSALDSRPHRRPHVDKIDGDPRVARTTTAHPESHVYEDISAENTSELLSERISFPDESRRTRENEDRRSADRATQLWIGGSPSAIDESSQPTPTQLSLSVGISANRDSCATSPRTSEDDPGGGTRDPGDHPGGGPLPADALERSASSSSFRGNEDPSSSTSSSDRRPNRRRRKKDCKHCRSKLLAGVASSCEKLDELAGSKDAILRESVVGDRRDRDVSGLLFRESLLRAQNVKIYPIVNRMSLRENIGAKRNTATASENGPRSTVNDTTGFQLNVENGRTLDEVAENNRNKMLGMARNGADMRINSIYSQDRWYGKESSIFCTDVKDQNPFQRAYSLPARTHTPTSQNRVNLRRSVRNDPPPHPARLDKHRRGWTLHLARPLKASGCSSPLVPLLVVVLLLLGVAGVALYIVFEPEKLQIIQQYLKSSTGKLTGRNVTSGEPIPNDEPSRAYATPTSTSMSMSASTVSAASADAFPMSALLNGSSLPASAPPPRTGAETEAAGRDVNATRHCDDCHEGEVCVALVDEEVPICRGPRDREDPTGCAGFCLINKERCHRLDVDAFRCVEIEHDCLEDEWTCSNALCIPLQKHCDGHMNCYDHSDEYGCVCNLETHFQCGNETSCLPLERRCDGKIDCWDASDEINCTLACPSDNEFTCNNGECILEVRFCDGLSDCSDKSDEPNGCQGPCNKHEFTCQNGRCITKGMKCNGVDDCGDGTDERYCKENRFI